ncbi:hypothetical protein JI752_006910 [Lysobacter sp. MMG2]|uniref:hypothetical protein n=1 Tax=Lysobacter sp. MMG2 TaxID=2801338 RepID=UPI001C2185AF|nr:hypothetical protein [Lysobacter sp. MMG2]MBU8975870.1 hypothetical protein [Lysobacter sp. MMG2]
MNAPPLAPRRLWWLGAGFALWCSALVVLYAVHAIGCRFAWASGSLRLTLAALLLAHMIAIGWLWHRFSLAMRGPGQTPISAFVHAVIVWTLVAALVSAIIALAPALLLTTCT